MGKDKESYFDEEDFATWYQRKYPDLEADKDDFYKQMEKCFEAGVMNGLRIADEYR
jgi:hypothetical protein